VGPCSRASEKGLIPISDWLVSQKAGAPTTHQLLTNNISKKERWHHGQLNVGATEKRKQNIIRTPKLYFQLYHIITSRILSHIMPTSTIPDPDEEDSPRSHCDCCGPLTSLARPVDVSELNK
jgi:hypothetical protein